MHWLLHVLEFAAWIRLICFYWYYDSCKRQGLLSSLFYWERIYSGRAIFSHFTLASAHNTSFSCHAFYYYIYIITPYLLENMKFSTTAFALALATRAACAVPEDISKMTSSCFALLDKIKKEPESPMRLWLINSVSECSVFNGNKEDRKYSQLQCPEVSWYHPPIIGWES